ncbi:unnamed protein product, partial [Iphiclides podalirius]
MSKWPAIVRVTQRVLDPSAQCGPLVVTAVPSPPALRPPTDTPYLVRSKNGIKCRVGIVNKPFVFGVSMGAHNSSERIVMTRAACRTERTDEYNREMAQRVTKADADGCHATRNHTLDITPKLKGQSKRLITSWLTLDCYLAPGDCMLAVRMMVCR